MSGTALDGGRRRQSQSWESETYNSRAFGDTRAWRPSLSRESERFYGSKTRPRPVVVRRALNESVLSSIALTFYFLKLFLVLQGAFGLLKFGADPKAKVRSLNTGNTSVQCFHHEWLVTQEILRV